MTTASPVTLAQLLDQASWAHRLARRLVHDSDEADDLVQETWLAALRRPPSAGGSLRPWLGTVLRRQRGKRALGERRRGAREEAVAELAEEVPSPEALLGRLEAQRLLAGLVTALDEPYRQTILLRYYEGLTSAEIAIRTKVPAATVRWRLKVALERLRAALDGRIEGGRERWVLLLEPLAPGEGDVPAGAATVGRGLSRSAVLAIAAAVGILPLVTWVVMRGRAGVAVVGEGEGAGPAAGEARAPDLPRPPRRGQGADERLAAATAGAPGCRALVEDLRRQVATAETEAMAVIRGSKLFGRGGANPAAERELAAPLARIMALGGRAPSYTLECRTWVCKMTVAQTPEEAARTNEWQLPLQTDLDLSARLGGRGFEGGGQVKDPLSGVVLTTKAVYLTLRDPSGKAMSPGDPMTPRPDLAVAPIPRDPAGCNREVDGLRARLAAAQADLEADMHPDTRFARSTPNPALTAEIAALLRRILGTEPVLPAVECRGRVCKVEGSRPTEAWRQRLEADPEFRLRLESGMCCRPIIYAIKTPEQVAAARWLHRVADAFVAGPAPASCQKQHAADGMLNLKFELPATGHSNGDGLADRVGLQLSGPLIGTPIARCIAEAFASSMHETAVPQPIPAAEVGRQLRFPLIAAPR